MIVVTTQRRENVGDYFQSNWAVKNGFVYKILNVPLDQDLQAVVDAAGIGHRNNRTEEYVIGWSVQSDDYLTEFESNQLKYQGQVIFKEYAIEYSELVAVSAE